MLESARSLPECLKLFPIETQKNLEPGLNNEAQYGKSLGLENTQWHVGSVGASQLAHTWNDLSIAAYY